jgi:hypothetical protein
MKLEQQVCTLEQAKKLRELGVDAKSYFNWVNHSTHARFSGYEWSVFNPQRIRDADEIVEVISAFTVAELGVMLPMIVSNAEDDFFLCMFKGNKGWLVEYHTNKKDAAVNSEGELDRPRGYLFNTYRRSYNLAEAMAEWLIVLLESKLITAEDCNKRLGAYK